jgi:hypothetical protein
LLPIQFITYGPFPVEGAVAIPDADVVVVIIVAAVVAVITVEAVVVIKLVVVLVEV